ncbi:natural resistance-associated macrophage protein-domain-containing protein [Crucibulum laeve]|uniref:Natural resistance-associated macrophage protein-domain-containing protein n=1 Tax=Crucibulum laeve TaxID=68775 RepID=A0A5C3M7K6_9AGAR|nr:natural resistance-associated macrophage protein-domain-containing protein [Crucibulum laeve]
MSLPPTEPHQGPQTVPSHVRAPTIKDRAVSAAKTVVLHVKKHVGVGIICSVAYFDPGNWSVDLQAGSSFGYRPMLFVILMAGLGAIVLQTLACKLGCVTGLDLASHCRLLLHDHPRHPRLVRRLVLYPLYVLAEIAIISTDLAELLGSAIGFCLIFPKLPLWAGVVLTAADVLVFLFFSDPSRGNGRPVRMFEFAIIGLVFSVFACFIALLVKASPDWSQVFMGYIPNKGLIQSQPDAVYAAVGILGATVMPHALFLGSSLAALDRVSLAPVTEPALPGPAGRRPGLWTRVKQYITPLFAVSRAERVAASRDYRTKYGDRENNSLSFIRQHLSHGIVDVITSLLALAVPINSAILILAAAVFFDGPGQHRNTPAGLFEAHDLINERLGKAAAFVFALALLCAGQTSSITVTLAGQIVSEGFIEWRVSPFFRRLITRCISLVPSVVVAVAVGKEGINTLLVASQVVLSIVLPFVAFPLIYLTSRTVVMRVRKPVPALVETETDETSIQDLPHDRICTEVEYTDGAPIALAMPVEEKITGQKVETSSVEMAKDYIDFSNSRWLACLSYVVWCVVLVANAYAIVMLLMRSNN